MSTTPSKYEAQSATTEKFYLPATTVPRTRGRVEAVVTDLFDLHGRVLMPRPSDR